jgi:tRNA pseudouridine38-40 synthase
MRVRLTVSYRGAAYAGWQFQANALTVQEVLERALASLLQTPVRVVGAGRTDAGVHARGQVAHFEQPAAAAHLALRTLVHGTNHWLPADVRVLAAHRMPEGFHARRAARGKEYSYRLSRADVLSPLDAPYVLQVPTRLAVAPMRLAVAALPGRHDFSAFAQAGGSHAQPFRTVESATLEGDGEELCFRIVADGFLRGMVRALVGTLLDVGLGRRSPADFAALLGGADRPASGPNVPAHGLVLEKVFYSAVWKPLE